jgi:hypothetical protein
MLGSPMCPEPAHGTGRMENDIIVQIDSLSYGHDQSWIWHPSVFQEA